MIMRLEETGLNALKSRKKISAALPPSTEDLFMTEEKLLENNLLLTNLLVSVFLALCASTEVFQKDLLNSLTKVKIVFPVN